MGGYSSGPVVVAAWMLGIKIVLCEQNILPGITNRILSFFADRVCVAFKETTIKFNQKKIRHTGNPVRREIMENTLQVQEKKEGDFIKDHPFTIFILGGSQGSHSINTAQVAAVKHIQNKKKYFFIHQTGTGDAKWVRDAYTRYGLACDARPFFDNIYKQYQKADLIICRAGATTVAEIAVQGKCAVFIPYPFAADNHQMLNARSIVNAGAADIILQNDLSPRLLAEKIEYYANHPDILSAMASKSKSLGRPYAAEEIVDDCYRLLKVAGNQHYVS